MQVHAYSPSEIQSLRPLLASIARELLEREQAISEIEQRCQGLGELPLELSERRVLTAELSGHRRARRHAVEELKRLGCSIFARRPLAFSVPALLRGETFTFVWNFSDLVRDPGPRPMPVRHAEESRPCA